MVEFTNLQMANTGQNLKFKASCSSNQGHFLDSTSSDFSVFPYPSTAMLRQTEITLTYKGPYKLVKKLLNTFNPDFGTLVCKGCPNTFKARADERKDHCYCTSPLADDDCTC